MLIDRPKHRVKVYDFSLTDEERRKIRINKKNISPIRKKFDALERRGKIRKMRERLGDPCDRCENRPRVKRWI